MDGRWNSLLTLVFTLIWWDDLDIALDVQIVDNERDQGIYIRDGIYNDYRKTIARHLNLKMLQWWIMILNVIDCRWESTCRARISKSGELTPTGIFMLFTRQLTTENRYEKNAVPGQRNSDRVIQKCKSMYMANAIFKKKYHKIPPSWSLVGTILWVRTFFSRRRLSDVIKWH